MRSDIADVIKKLINQQQKSAAATCQPMQMLPPSIPRPAFFSYEHRAVCVWCLHLILADLIFRTFLKVVVTVDIWRNI